ncbi:uncharacterized protein TM35_000341690 [Trypanosoma theileri]|uniref:CID domain-containing protein n=1 Tax=Trypanosoma theileri TaxID=67003 RepID=A0A1X0NLM3_9TRYP|nr:uncharacterized protein TM35_000341690 [Trypanosoma theileri]ORC85557.1 hypothetical protein TM35_000341690 [Trypanosoma theileri]
MNKEKVGRRLDLVSSSSGSIISVAAWCALQASSADVIMSAIDERMRAASTTDATRCALLYVLHELLLTCAANGVPETSKRAVLLAVSRTLPATVRAVRERKEKERREEKEEEGGGAFEEALARVGGWWARLNIFPRPWLAQLAGPPQAARSSIPARLRHIAAVIAQYNETKENSAREEALQQLAQVRAIVDDELGGGAALNAWLDAERDALQGNVQNTVSPSTQQKEEDDVLGSFF